MSESYSKTLRSILVHIDGTAACAARLGAARQVASRTGGIVFGMFVAAPPSHPAALAVSEAPGALLEPQDWAVARGAKAQFDEAAAEGGVAMHWLDSIGTNPHEAFQRNALLADLLVLGQHQPGVDDGLAAPPGFVESLLIETGQPGLVLPHAGLPADIGRTVLIGWNATPPAAHAVAAALPWLRSARAVHVLSPGDAGDVPQGRLDIGRYLQCHGVEATVHRGPQGDAGLAAEALLGLVRELRVDLLVMGCYGHGRAWELLAGGVSRSVLQAMTVPVLMAH